jgi:hypothetical protein
MIANHRIQVLISLVIIGAAPIAAADLTKEECVEAHSKGQDAREQGKLSLARKLFMTCAQPVCPALVQGDCARFADDLGWSQPSLTFAARDAAGNDLPDTTVYVDDILVVTRLDDGRPHDVDPGKHIVRFTNGGHEQTVTVVVGAGEKGRPIVASFGGGKAGAGGAPPEHKEPMVKHPTGARFLIIGGTAGAVGGLTLGIIGLARMPAGCSLSSHQCSAAPGDPVFGNASGAARMVNYGWVLGSAGIAALAGGIVWYTRGSETVKESNTVVSPWFGPGSAGLAVAGAL